MAEVSIVQFMGLSSQYKAHDPLKVSYRYAIEGDFEASSQDFVGVFADEATSEEDALVTVSIDDTTTHRLCDGGLYKTGSVTLECPAETEKGDRYRFWYISSKTGQVVGRSNTFTLCASDSEYLSISLGSMDVSNDLHTRNLSASYVDVGESFNSAPSTLGSSFVVVSEGNSCEVPGSQYTVAETRDAGETMNREVVDNDSTGKMSGDETIATQVKANEGGEELVSSMPQSISGSMIQGNYLECLPFANSSPASTAAESIKSAEVMVALEPAKIKLLSPSMENEAGESSERCDSSLKSSSTSNLPSPSPTFPLDCADIAEMSSSTVVVEKHITQREARVLKTSNKELRSKINKLSDILEQKKVTIDGLVKQTSENEKQLQEVQQQEKLFEAVKKDLTDNVSSLERQLKEHNEKEQEQNRHIQALQRQVQRGEDSQREVERLNKELLCEKSALEEKVKRLLEENKTMFERSTKLLSQLMDSETKREVERSEKKVLQGKIDYLGAELRRFKLLEAQGEAVSGGQLRQSSGLGYCADRHAQAGSSGKQMKQPPGAGTSGRSEPTMLPPNSRQQHHFHRERPGQSTERALRSKQEKKESIFESSSSCMPPAASNIRPNELPLRAGNSRIGQTGREYPWVLPLSRPQDQKQDIASVVPLSNSGQRKSAGPTVEGRINYETLQEGERRGVGGATRGELPPMEGGVECPICGKQLPSGGNDFGVLLHVEQCIQLSEGKTT